MGFVVLSAQTPGDEVESDPPVLCLTACALSEVVWSIPIDPCYAPPSKIALLGGAGKLYSESKVFARLNNQRGQWRKQKKRKAEKKNVSGFEVQISPCSGVEQVDGREKIMVARPSDAAELCIPMQALIHDQTVKTNAHLQSKMRKKKRTPAFEDSMHWQQTVKASPNEYFC